MTRIFIRKLFKGFCSLALTIITFALMIGLFELFFFFIDRDEYVINYPQTRESHPILGTDNIPDYRCRHCIQKYDQSFVFKTYTIKDGNRVSVGNDDSKDKFIALFGCSYAFGWGCNDDETFLSRVGQYLPEYNLYNFGVSGSATQHMYWKLKSGKVREMVKEEEGLGIYMFWGFQPARIDMFFRTDYAYVFPYFEYDPSIDDLRCRGTIGGLHPWQKYIYNILRKSNVLNHIKFEFPPYTNNLIDKFVDQVHVSRNYFINAFEKGRFIVFIPAPESTFPKMQYFKEKLRQRNIEYLQCSKKYYEAIESLNINDTMYPDGHLTPLTQDLLAREFCHLLEASHKEEQMQQQ